MRNLPLLGVLLAAACRQADHRSVPDPSPVDKTSLSINDAEPRTDDSSTSREAGRPPAVTIAAGRTLAEWRKADNRERCAPLVLTSDGGAKGEARRANFSGGWAVAFDRPAQRSLYGVAGTGVRVADAREEQNELQAQWPYNRLLAGGSGDLPAGAMAGYGVEGARAYPADNPSGEGLNSLAYVVIPGQRCLYNVWSKLGRKHLETLLDGLTILPTD